MPSKAKSLRAKMKENYQQSRGLKSPNQGYGQASPVHETDAHPIIDNIPVNSQLKKFVFNLFKIFLYFLFIRLCVVYIP